MTAGRKIAAIAGAIALLAGGVVIPARGQVPTDTQANVILQRVKASVRVGERPAYVVYTLVRRDSIDGVPSLLNSYTLKIWCRTSDGAALARHVNGGRAGGPAEFIVPAFDRPIDPGPPTADLLDVIAQTQNHGSPMPAVPAGQRVIGSVSAIVERDYHVTFAGIAGADDHLRLEARRDPDRNRLTDLYVDRVTFALHRAVAHDHLFADGRAIPERFEIDFGVQGTTPVIVAIHGQTDYSAIDARDRGEPFHEVTYRFEDIAFADDFPAWYFDPALYGAHRAEFPQ